MLVKNNFIEFMSILKMYLKIHGIMYLIFFFLVQQMKVIRKILTSDSKRDNTYPLSPNYCNFNVSIVNYNYNYNFGFNSILILTFICLWTNWLILWHTNCISKSYHKSKRIVFRKDYMVCSIHFLVPIKTLGP